MVLSISFTMFAATASTQRALNSGLQQAGWETVLNRRGTTWRKLDSSIQESTDKDNVGALLVEHPAMIKRPVLDLDGSITVGFKAENYQAIFKKKAQNIN